MFGESRMRFQGVGSSRDAQRFNSPVRLDAADAREFRAIHAFVLFGQIAVEGIECQRPHNTQRAENVKNRAPAERQQDAAGNEWRDGYSEAAEEMRGALDAAALDARKPQLHAAAGHRKCARLTQSEQKAGAEKRTESERGAGHDRGGRPQRHDNGQHALRPEAVPKPTRREFGPARKPT